MKEWEFLEKQHKYLIDLRTMKNAVEKHKIEIIRLESLINRFEKAMEICEIELRQFQKFYRESMGNND